MCVAGFAPTHPPGAGVSTSCTAVGTLRRYRPWPRGAARSAGLGRFGDTSLVGFVCPFLVRDSLL